MPPIFVPTAKQQEGFDLVFSAGNDEILMGGTRGSAKTIFIAWIAWSLGVIFPGIKILVSRKDFNDLAGTTMAEFDRFCATYHPDVVLKKNNASPASRSWTVAGVTSQVIFSESKDALSMRSQNLGALLLEEAIEIPEDFYLEVSAACGRCVVDPELVPEKYRHLLVYDSQGGAHPPSRTILASNAGPGWVTKLFPWGNGQLPAKRTAIREFDDPETGERRTAQVRRVFLPSFCRDNPHLPPDYEAKLRMRYGATYARRMLDNDPTAFEGQIFVEFNPTPGGPHVWTLAQMRKIPLRTKEWAHTLALDWGFKNPAAAVFVTQDYDGNFWVWGEYRAAGRTPAQHAPYLARMLENLSAPVLQKIDPAAQDQSNGVSIATQFNELEGYDFSFSGWSKAKHGPDGSIVFVKQLLAAGRLRIAEWCAGLIGELIEARWQDQTARAAETRNEPERMVDKNDHSIDALFGALEEWRGQPQELSAGVAARVERLKAEASLRNMIDKSEDGRKELRQFEAEVGDVWAAHGLTFERGGGGRGESKSRLMRALADE